MAAASPSPTSLSLSLSLDTLLSSSHRLSTPSSLPFPSPASSSSAHKPHHLSIKSSSSPSPPPPTTTTTFLDPISLRRLRSLDVFHLSHQFPHGSLRIRPMAPHELDPTVSLLAESFAESMWMPSGYVKLVEFLVRQYVVERRNLLPHSIMLVGFYEEKDNNGESEGGGGGGGGGVQLACTAEVTFDAIGAPAAPPTPLPPRNCPYICNMTVKKAFRRRGIGRQLLKACEELIFQMNTMRKVYLHCRVIDTVPLQMYTKAGYKIVKQDSILIWLSLQRRKYLMCKEIPPQVEPQLDSSDSKDDPL